MSRFLLLAALLLQLTPQIHWKSEVKESPEGQQIVLTGDLDEGIDHVTGTVTYMPCKGDACYMPVDWDFEAFFQPAGEGRIGLGNVSPGSDRSGGSAVPELTGEGGASGDRSHPRLRKREGPADEVSGRGPAQQDVFGGNPAGSQEFGQEGIRAVHKNGPQEAPEPVQPADKLKIDKKKLIIYSEILKPKFDA
jgi:hypothetical protein